MHHSYCVFLYQDRGGAYFYVSPSRLGGDRGAYIFISITVFHSQVEMEMEDGLIAIIHNDFPSTFSVEVGEGLICVIHSVLPLRTGGGGVYLHPPQSVSLNLIQMTLTPPTPKLWRHTVDDANKPLPSISTQLEGDTLWSPSYYFPPKLEGNTLWMIQMSPSTTS